MRNNSYLAEYLEDLYDRFKKNRRPLELKWNDNYSAYKAIDFALSDSSSEVVPKNQWKKGEGTGWRSKTYLQKTKMKILAAWSMIIDVFLQGGEIPFALKPSPWDEIQFENLPSEEVAQIKNDINTMSRRIRQQLHDCNADRHFMKNILSAAIYGETYAKKTIIQIVRRGYKRISMKTPKKRYDRFVGHENRINSPAWEYVSLWEIFRDLETDDLQAGSGIIQRQLWSPYQLHQKIGKPFYEDHTDAIERVLKNRNRSSDNQPADIQSLPPNLREAGDRFRDIDIKEYWCRAPRQAVEDFEKRSADKGMSLNYLEDDGDEIEIHAIKADDEVVRFARMPDGERPYYRAVFEIDLDGSAGCGIADNMKDCQFVMNGMVRALEDNSKLLANVIIATKENLLDPTWDGEIHPGCRISVSDECDDARKAIQQIVFQSVIGPLIEGLALFDRWSDESSMIPKILQGEVAAKKKPDTAYELSQLMQNANRYTAGVIKNLDEGIVEPFISEFYEYNMLDPQVTEGKGNYVAKATGFNSFQDRVIRIDRLMKALNIVMSSPALAGEVKLRLHLEEIYKALDLDADSLLKTPEEKKADQEQQELIRQQTIELLRKQKVDDIQAEEYLKTVDAKHDLTKQAERFQGEMILKSMDGGVKEGKFPKKGMS